MTIYIIVRIFTSCFVYYCYLRSFYRRLIDTLFSRVYVGLILIEVVHIQVVHIDCMRYEVYALISCRVV